ncbi:MAG: hypothetical protein APR54_01680 [Candidatus Cloacimonas sp. SDB]|nr:MAG: hypothetical protein APR54_01680 [Candidatus Cloacimonas sp. SDB]
MKIIKPTLVINKAQVIRNISRMAAVAGKHRLFFRPHFKTHQSRTVGEWFREKGISAITVSSVEMAEYFQEAGWQDITIAIPCNLREYEQIDQLAGKCDLKILIVNTEAVHFLKKKLNNPTSFLIEIDNGYHRTGLDASDKEAIDNILDAAGKNEILKFQGFLTHSGNSYLAKNLAEIRDIHKKTLEQMRELKIIYSSSYPEMIISLGDTPSCSLLNDFEGVDEIRPGNFVFFDLMQEQLKVCKMEEIAVALACPVIAKNAERLEIALYGGAIHLSKEFILDKHNNRIFGKVVLFNEKGWSKPVPDATLFSISQEHGIVKTKRKFFDQIKIGDIVGILPVHSCLTADAMGGYTMLNGLKIDHL